MSKLRQQRIPGAVAVRSFGADEIAMIRDCPTCGKKNRIPPAHLADTGKCGHCRADLPPVNEPLEVDEQTFSEVISGARVPVLVDFWASWCPPCRMVAPQVHQAAKERAGKAVVLKVDTEANPRLAQRFQVQGIPNFLVFRGGKPVFQQAGAVDHRELVRWIDRAA